MKNLIKFFRKYWLLCVVLFLIVTGITGSYMFFSGFFTKYDLDQYLAMKKYPSGPQTDKLMLCESVSVELAKREWYEACFPKEGIANCKLDRTSAYNVINKLDTNIERCKSKY